MLVNSEKNILPKYRNQFQRIHNNIGTGELLDQFFWKIFTKSNFKSQ